MDTVQLVMAALDKFGLAQCPKCECFQDWRDYVTHEEIAEWVKKQLTPRNLTLAGTLGGKSTIVEFMGLDE